MKLSIFCPFGLKMPIHAPNMEVLGGFHQPYMVSGNNGTPKRHILAQKHAM